MISFGSISTIIGIIVTLCGVVQYSEKHLTSGSSDFYPTVFIIVLGLILAVMGIVFLVVGFSKKSQNNNYHNSKSCPKCGNILYNNEEFCSKCGNDLRNNF